MSLPPPGGARSGHDVFGIDRRLRRNAHRRPASAAAPTRPAPPSGRSRRTRVREALRPFRQCRVALRAARKNPTHRLASPPPPRPGRSPRRMPPTARRVGVLRVLARAATLMHEATATSARCGAYSGALRWRSAAGMEARIASGHRAWNLTGSRDTLRPHDRTRRSAEAILAPFSAPPPSRIARRPGRRSRPPAQAGVRLTRARPDRMMPSWRAAAADRSTMRLAE